MARSSFGKIAGQTRFDPRMGLVQPGLNVFVQPVTGRSGRVMLNRLPGSSGV
jgi:hypothetical protein